jgi:hypothetical protein
MKISKKSKFIIVICAILTVGILLMTPWGSNIFPTATGNYGTGLTVDTKSKNAVIGGSSDAIVNYNYITVTNALNHADPGEIMDSSRYILSWQPNEYSTAITARVDAQWVVKYDKLWSISYLFGDYPQTIIQKDYWWDVTLTDILGKTTRIIDGKNFTGGASDTSVKKDWVYIQSGYPRRWFPGLTDSAWQISDGEQWYSKASSGTYALETETLVFAIKGPRVGYLTVRCYIDDTAYALSDEGLPLITTRKVETTGTRLLSEDKAYLASGIGNVQIDSINSIGTEGTANAGGTGVTYTKYVWAEGQDVTFNVKTGYSGISLEPDQEGYREGWYLKITNSKGETVKTGDIVIGGVTKSLSSYTNGLIPLADGLTNYKIKYKIPTGAFIINDPNDNEWMVTLSNTLFDQSETRLFVVDSLLKVPGQAKAEFDKNQYKQWETCKLTLSAKPNTAGTNDILHFRVWVTYDSWTSTNYALTARSVPAVKSGDSYTATVTFQVSKGDKNLYATTVAIDSQHRAGPEGEDQAFVEQVIPNPNPVDDILSGDYNWLIILAIFVIIIIFVLLYIFQKRGTIKFGTFKLGRKVNKK